MENYKKMRRFSRMITNALDDDAPELDYGLLLCESGQGENPLISFESNINPEDVIQLLRQTADRIEIELIIATNSEA